jgi:hypothetical protein
MFWLAGGGAPAPCPGGWPAPFGSAESCACADNASNDMAETMGMTIFMRLDALMRAYPLNLRNGRSPRAIDDSDRARVMSTDITDLSN